MLPDGDKGKEKAAKKTTGESKVSALSSCLNYTSSTSFCHTGCATPASSADVVLVVLVA